MVPNPRPHHQANRKSVWSLCRWLFEAHADCLKLCRLCYAPKHLQVPLWKLPQPYGRQVTPLSPPAPLGFLQPWCCWDPVHQSANRRGNWIRRLFLVVFAHFFLSMIFGFIIFRYFFDVSMHQDKKKKKKKEGASLNQAWNVLGT